MCGGNAEGGALPLAGELHEPVRSWASDVRSGLAPRRSVPNALSLQQSLRAGAGRLCGGNPPGRKVPPGRMVRRGLCARARAVQSLNAFRRAMPLAVGVLGRLWIRLRPL